IIARWIAAPEFTEADGRPRPLPRAAETGPSFESLVASVTRDLRPRAVLDEWLDRGLVTLDAEERIVLAEAAFVPSGGGSQQLYYFGRNLHDHIAASVANILDEKPRFLERAVHYDGLSPALARRLELRAREIAMEALQQANREAHAACETDPGGEARWNFGIYIYAEDAPRPVPAAVPPEKGAP
ncbi:DUF6502 family protein, partial [Methylobacterium indicum]